MKNFILFFLLLFGCDIVKNGEGDPATELVSIISYGNGGLIARKDSVNIYSSKEQLYNAIPQRLSQTIDSVGITMHNSRAIVYTNRSGYIDRRLDIRYLSQNNDSIFLDLVQIIRGYNCDIATLNADNYVIALVHDTTKEISFSSSTERDTTCKVPLKGGLF